MTQTTPQAALLDYFDDLLGSGDDLSEATGFPAATPESLLPVPPAPAPQPAQRPLRGPTRTAEEELAVLEEAKREKLQALLNSKPLPLAAEPARPAEPPPAVTEQSAPAKPVVEDKAPPREQAPVADAPALEEPVAEVPEALSPFLAWHENGRPNWAQQPFEALLFDVSGLTLAVPLIALGQIHPLTEELTPIFGQADWFMGILPTANGRVRTINTALFVMPERYDPGFTDTAKYVVSIDGVPWGLAVDRIHQPKALNPGDVKWRTERSKRPWLAGTVKSAMCALLDVPQIGQMLTEADRPR